RQDLVGAVQVQAPRQQGVAGVEVGPGVAAVVVAEAGHRRGQGARAVGVHGLGDAVAEGVVGVVGTHQQRAAVGGALLGPHQAVVVVVAVRPGLGVGPLGLLDQVALVVVAVRPGAVGQQAVAGAGLVARHRPVAVGVVAVAVAAVAGQLAGR